MSSSLPQQMASLEKDALSERQSLYAGGSVRSSQSSPQKLPPAIIESRPSTGHRRSMTIVACDD
jgi:hypothetical protein